MINTVTKLFERNKQKITIVMNFFKLPLLARAKIKLQMSCPCPFSKPVFGSIDQSVANLLLSSPEKERNGKSKEFETLFCSF
jgi:hypothetical protein